LIYPRSCFGCGHSGIYLCPICRTKIVTKSIRRGDRLSLFRYHGAVKKLIIDLKFHFVSDVTDELSSLIADSITTKYPNLLSYWQEKAFVLVPIPLHHYRFNWRGFNQSVIVCQQLSSKLKLHFDPSVLQRVKHSIPQTKVTNKLHRRQNVASSFEITNSKYQNVIIFDDVYTTGSTISAAKSVFTKTTQVWTLTIAG